MSPITKLKYSKPIAKYIRQAVQDGVQVKDILATINHKYQNAPRNYAMLYKYYGGDIAEARGEITQKIGNVVVQQALSGHYPSQELYLRSKSGCSPKETQQTEEVSGDADENSSAIDSLMTLLGKRVDEAEDPEDNSWRSPRP